MYLNSMFAREVRNLVRISEALADGQPSGAVYKRFRVWDKRKTIVSKCLQQRNKKDLLSCLAHSASVDARVKGIQNGDPWIPLEDGLLSLSGV